LAVVLWLQLPAGDEEVGAWRSTLRQWLTEVPLWAYMASFVVLPAFGFPLSLYYLTVVAVLGAFFPAVLVAWACMAGNMAVSYAVARVLSRPVRVLAERRGYLIPRIDARSEWKVILAVRISPLPWLAQSIVLALGGARFLPYMLFGVPVQAVVGLGFILVGESLFSGELSWALIGLPILLVYVLLLRIGRRPRR
jgi:uncharacterized membrane protein YdjX (TVP38/TMEM64 family)